MTTATEITAALPKATKAFARIEPLDWLQILVSKSAAVVCCAR